MRDRRQHPKRTNSADDRQQNRAVRWVAAIAWMLVILAASAWPQHGPPSAQGTDKVFHFVAYAVLTVLLFRCWWTTAARSRLAIAICRASIIAIGYGLLLELYQLRVPGRECQLSDILANCTGVVIAALIMLYLGSLSANKRRTDNVGEEQ